MIRNFFATPTVVGKLMIALLFVSGAVFAGAFDGFVVETEASCCCLTIVQRTQMANRMIKASAPESVQMATNVGGKVVGVKNNNAIDGKTQLCSLSELNV